MKATRSILHYSLFAVILGVVSFDANSAIRVGNHSRSYAQAYQQVNEARMGPQPIYVNQPQPGQNTTTPTTNTVATQNTDGTAAVDDVNVIRDARMERCSMIYPNGEFDWTQPTVGRGAGGADTCTAIVEMRGYQMGQDGSDVVLARAYLASGDAMICNISEFPSNSYTVDAESIVFPADAAPTMDDVVDVMNQEQKKNAGLKIAAGAIIGGLGGNMLGQNDRGNDSLLGTDTGKLQGTAIGAVLGSGLMAANAYTGKVAGDTILSAGVNATAGSVIGNMAATGGSVLRIEDCTIPDGADGAGRRTSCLWGVLATTTPLTTERAFFNIDTNETFVCDANMTNCKEEELASIRLAAYPDANIEDVTDEQFERILANSSYQYYVSSNNGVISMVPATQGGDNVDVGRGIYALVSSAGRIDRQMPAMLEMRDKAFGLTQADWREWRRNNRNGVTIYGRTTNGDAYALSDNTDTDVQNFYPMMVDATDGSLIDFGNKARLKSTLIGAGVGGALGGFVGYQGAQNDVQNRWVTAVREYEDSLQKVYCATGNRFLGYYNDQIFIPNMAGTADTTTE